MPAHPTPGWGAPPNKPRPRSAPRTYPILDRAAPKTKGPSFGLARKDRAADPVPGPLAYKPCDSSFCVCKPCEAYKGPSFGLRPPTIYGATQRFGRTIRDHNTGPSPAEYHVDCSTIGAATQICESAKVKATVTQKASRALAGSRHRM